MLNLVNTTAKLCKVSYGAFGIKSEWKQFVKTLPFTTTFLHKDEYIKQFPDCYIDFPSLLYKNGPDFKTLLSAHDFTKIKSLKD